MIDFYGSLMTRSKVMVIEANREHALHTQFNEICQERIMYCNDGQHTLCAPD